MAGMNVNWQWRGLNFNPELKGQLQRGIEEGGLDAFAQGFKAMKKNRADKELASLFSAYNEAGNNDFSSMSDAELEAEIQALKNELGMNVKWR